MSWLLVVMIAALLHACTLPPRDGLTPLIAPEESLPMPASTVTPTPPITLADLLAPTPSIPECIVVEQLPSFQEQPASAKAGVKPVAWRQLSPPAPAKPLKVPTPQEIIAKAEKDALVEPNSTMFFGKSIEARVEWQAGQIYKILLKREVQTMISFPPHEKISIGLALDKKDFLVRNERVGKEEAAYFIVSITPLPLQVDEKGIAQGGATDGTYDVSLVTDIGHKYQLRLVVGNTAMRDFVFMAPTIHEAGEVHP